MSQTQHDALSWQGRNVVDPNGDKVGKIEEIYLDHETDQPEWLLVKTGLFGSKGTFVPIQGASAEGDGDVRVRFDKDQVKDAPNIDADQQLSQDEEAAMYRHYGMGYGEHRSDSGLPEGGTHSHESAAGHAGHDHGTTGHDTSGPTTDDAMTISEEQLRVGTEQREAGRARLRKYVVSETQQVPVTTRREEVRLEREPITDANRGAAHDGPAISEEEHEVVLHEERPVVAKEAVAKERVRLDKETVAEEQTVSEEVRREEVELEGDTDAKRRR